MTSRLQQLTDQGVAVWVDSIARDWIQKGELRRLRDQFQVVGVTSNPTIFQKAMGEGSFYDDDIARLAGRRLDARRIFESLALDDIRAAAADMEPVWERTDGLDGRISFEVPPDIADDTEATIRETRRLLEELAEAGGDLTEVASVASFFVSRVDTMVDKELQALVDKGGPEAEAARGRLGTAAIDNAKLAYEVFQQAFQGPRWEELAARGARVQRPLWASTSTKNPAYRDVLYVEELVARDTVNTMPIETIEAFADHGEARGQTATEGMDRAHRLWSDLAALGIDEDDIGDRLEREGVEKFADSYNGAVDSIEAKREKLAR
jgi:transaldolase